MWVGRDIRVSRRPSWRALGNDMMPPRASRCLPRPCPVIWSREQVWSWLPRARLWALPRPKLWRQSLPRHHSRTGRGPRLGGRARARTGRTVNAACTGLHMRGKRHAVLARRGTCRVYVVVPRWKPAPGTLERNGRASYISRRNGAGPDGLRPVQFGDAARVGRNAAPGAFH